MKAASSNDKTVTRDGVADVAIATERTSAAQRQWAYRQRRKRALIEAIGNEVTASRTTLLALLAHELATLEGRTASVNMIGPARNTARRIMTELITRYSIEL